MTSDYADTPQGREAARLLGLVRDAMADQGVTQSELARRTGYGRSYISMLMNDREDADGKGREASVGTALTLGLALGVVRIVEDEA